MARNGFLLRISTFFLLAFSCQELFAQGVQVPGGVCRPVSQRTPEMGCRIMADDPVGTLMESPVFWHLDAYTTRAAAEADKGPRSTVFESLGKV